MAHGTKFKNFKIISGEAIFFQMDTKPAVQLKPKPDPDCDRCGISQRLGKVIYCSCMVIRPEIKHRGN